MKHLKSLIAVYDETIVVKGHHFRVESHRDIMKTEDDSIYELYDSDKLENDLLIASVIINYEGVIEIAAAYITGDKTLLNEAKSKWCIAPDF